MKPLDEQSISRIRTNLYKMESDRAVASQVREEIAAFSGGNEYSFLTTHSSIKDRTDETNQLKKKKVYSSTFANSANIAASGIHSSLLNGIFHGIRIKELDLGDGNKITDPNSTTLREEQERLTDELFELRNRSESGFYTAAFQVISDVILYGDGVLLVDWITDRARGLTSKGYQGLKYMAVPIEQVYYTLNAYDFPDRVYRAYHITVAAIFELAMNSSVQDVTENQSLKDWYVSDPTKLVKVVHVVELNPEFKPDDKVANLNRGNKKYVEYTVVIEPGCTISASGHDIMPYAIASGVRRSGKTYGEGYGYVALPAAKSLNIMEENQLAFADMALNPAFITSSASDTDLMITPGSVLPGMMSEDGTPLIQQLPLGNNQLALQEMGRLEQQIKDVFNVDLYLPLSRKMERMTVAEVTGRMQERGIAIGPIARSLQENFLTHVLNIELYHLLAQKKKYESKSTYKLDAYFTAPFNQDLAAAKISSILNLYQALTVVANTTGDPSVMDVVNTDQAGFELVLASGAPTAMARERSEIENIRKNRASIQQQQMALENAQGMAALATAQSKLVSATSPEGLTNTPGQPTGPAF